MIPDVVTAIICCCNRIVDRSAGACCCVDSDIRRTGDMGGCVSFTVTLKVQVAVRPPASVAVNVTVVPIGKVAPLAVVQFVPL